MLTSDAVYLQPEMVLNKAYSAVVDSWTVGVLCYEFLTGYPPFGGMTQVHGRIQELVATYGYGLFYMCYICD